jgi:hypothetical protein
MAITMTVVPSIPGSSPQDTAQGCLRRIARNEAGNVIIIAAAALFPLLALIGSGIDMGRGYLAETRLQQACDAGTLAARKRLGTSVGVNGAIPDTVADTGQRFFNINFRDGSHGSVTRNFVMTMEEDLSISGVATAQVPTMIMGVFGFDMLQVSASCSAQINMANTDIMMVLDTTGSMLSVNSGDTVSRMDAMRSTVESFHAQMEANKTPGTRIRYGFLPYSTNVNVGHLLHDDWLVDEWSYNFRERRETGGTTEVPITETVYEYISGTWVNEATTSGGSCPASNMTWNSSTPTTDSDGWTITEVVVNGTYYSCSESDGGEFRITPNVANNYRYYTKSRPNGTQTVVNAEWRYANFNVDLSFLETTNYTTYRIGGSPSSPYDINAYYRGCIEERDTYYIDDYANVDLTRALDLDIDRIPDPANPATQWRPMLNELSFIREVRSNGNGPFTPGPVNSPEEFVNAWWWGYGACPPPAHQLSEMSAAQVTNYVNSLVAQGNTYHDIGMIWGGRLLSPNGLFAADNADVSGNSTSRHMIFLTDGETAPLDISYGAYGIEPLDRRRWRQTSPMTLTETVENRFTFACEEVKKRNIQVWVISFGTGANPIMENCAGQERYFVADDAAALEETFSTIARRMGELRIVR